MLPSYQLPAIESLHWRDDSTVTLPFYKLSIITTDSNKRTYTAGELHAQQQPRRLSHRLCWGYDQQVHVSTAYEHFNNLAGGGQIILRVECWDYNRNRFPLKRNSSI